MLSKKGNSYSTQDISSSIISQDTDDYEILRHEQDHDESLNIESSPVISNKSTTRDITCEKTTPDNESVSLICPKSPSKKNEDLRLYPIKSRKKLALDLDILVPLSAISEKEQQDIESTLEEECKDINTVNKSEDNKNGKAVEPKGLQSKIYETSIVRPPLRELVLKTPDIGIVSLQSTISASRNSENITSSGFTPPFLLGSTISGISTLHYTSSDAKSEGSYRSKSAIQINSNLQESSSTEDVFLTSTPRHTSKVFDWEELSNVTDGLSDCSSLRPLRKNSKFTYSSDLPFSDFSQESCGSNGSNEEKGEVFPNSSQELSGSDKENIEPRCKFIMKRNRHSSSSPYIKAKSFCKNDGRQISSQPLGSKRRRHRSNEDIDVRRSLSLSQAVLIGSRECLREEKRIKVDAGLDCDDNDDSHHKSQHLQL